MKENKNELPSETVELLPLDQCYISEQNTRARPKPTDAKIIELSISMAALGQIAPGIVRKTEKGYEICAGARRLVAAKLNGLPHFRAVVRQMTDDEFEEQLLVENLQREDPDPIGEVKLIERLFKRGLRTADQIAAHAGKPKNWAYRRLQVMQCIEPFLKSWSTGKPPCGHFDVSMMELLGSLPQETQKQIASQKWWYNNVRTRKDLSRWLEREITCRLDKTPFDLNDPKSFVKGCGPGCACDSRKQSQLFDFEGTVGRCLNPECFHARFKKSQDATIEKIRKEHGKLPVVTSNYLGHDFKIEVDGRKIEPSRVYGTIAPKPKQKDDRKVMTVHESGHISVGYLPKETRNADAPDFGTQGRPIKTQGQRLKERKAILCGQRLIIVHKELLAALKAAKLKDCRENVCDLVAIFGTPWRIKYRGEDGWERFDARKKKGYVVDLMSSRNYVESDEGKFRTRDEALWGGLQLVLEEVMEPVGNVGQAPEAENDMRRVAKLIGFKFDEALKKACEQKRAPKSFGTVDQYTLEPITGLDLLKKVGKKKGRLATPAEERRHQKKIRRAAAEKGGAK